MTYKNAPAVRQVPAITENMTRWESAKAFFWGTNLWELIEDFEFELPSEYGSIWIKIPKGFRFDGASVPRIFWNFISPTGPMFIPGLIHDFAYKYNYLLNIEGKKIMVGAGRWYFDMMFKDVSNHVTHLITIPWLAWTQLKWWGFIAWNNHRKNDAILE